MTQEEIDNSVIAAFDSVNYIEEYDSIQNPSEEETARVFRNIQHLEIMLSKQWFSDALTNGQKTTIQTSIQ